MTSSHVLNQKRILVADDEKIIADTLQMILFQNGYEVAVAYDGRAAVETARQFRPQILLCDVMMPERNGVEAAIEIRGIIPECKILLFSGRAGVHDLLQEARASGHQFELLLKPVHPSELLERLHSLGLSE